MIHIFFSGRHHQNCGQDRSDAGGPASGKGDSDQQSPCITGRFAMEGDTFLPQQHVDGYKSGYMHTQQDYQDTARFPEKTGMLIEK